jgi:Family of unknown function (DUF5681)
MTTISAKPSRRKRGSSRPLSNPPASNAPYRVGPGCPPKEYQFKPGQSGNPAGARNRPPSIAPDLKALLQAALGKKVTLTIGDKERILTKAAAGIEQLVDQFARGDRYARRDLFDLADKLGLDLGASSKAALEELTGKALTAEDEALVADFLKRKSEQAREDNHPDAAHNQALKQKGSSDEET